MAQFLGLDLSTQQLKAVVASESGSVLHETAVNFDRDLPQYGTQSGAIHGPGAGQVTSPVALWVDAFDLLLERMKNEGVEFSRIMGISGSGQVCLRFSLQALCILTLPTSSNMVLSTGRTKLTLCWDL